MVDHLLCFLVWLNFALHVFLAYNILWSLCCVLCCEVCSFFTDHQGYVDLHQRPWRRTTKLSWFLSGAGRESSVRVLLTITSKQIEPGCTYRCMALKPTSAAVDKNSGCHIYLCKFILSLDWIRYMTVITSLAQQSKTLRWLKAVSSTFQDIDFDVSLFPLVINKLLLMLQSWYQKTAQSLVNTLSFSSHYMLP